MTTLYCVTIRIRNSHAEKTLQFVTATERALALLAIEDKVDILREYETSETVSA